jgi:hypothetical protein
MVNDPKAGSDGSLVKKGFEAEFKDAALLGDKL